MDRWKETINGGMKEKKKEETVLRVMTTSGKRCGTNITRRCTGITTVSTKNSYPTEEGWVPRTQSETDDTRGTRGDVVDNMEVHGAEVDNNDCDEHIDTIPGETDTVPNDRIEQDVSEDNDVGDDEDDKEPSDGGGGRKRRRGKKTANHASKGSSSLSESRKAILFLWRWPHFLSEYTLVTRMPFSRRHTIRITHRSHKHLQ